MTFCSGGNTICYENFFWKKSLNTNLNKKFIKKNVGPNFCQAQSGVISFLVVVGWGGGGYRVKKSKLLEIR